MKDKTFHRPERLESIYRNELDRLFNKYFDFPSATTLGEINARLVELAQAKSFFSSVGENIAKKMITMVAKNNALSWKQAATKASNSRIINQMLKRDIHSKTLVGIALNNLISENSTLIKTIPESIKYKLSKWVQEQEVKGLRSSEIAKMMAPRLNYLKNYEIARLARTELAKADTAITRVRAQSIGLNWYQWLTSNDSRVRIGHKLMDYVLVNWDDAPAPELLAHEKSEGHYHAGNIYNCRCIAVPITNLAEISWPAKVYTQSKIKRLSRKQFALLSGISKQLAA